MDIGNIIVAVLALIGTVCGSMMANNKLTAVIQAEVNANKELTKQQIDAVKEDIADLKKSQDKHNQVIERTVVVERDLKTAFNRIDELCSDIKDLQKEK